MANMSEKYTADCAAGQKKIEKIVIADTTADEMDEKRTTLSLSLTVNDKKALKMMAAEQETTIAAIIHEWVQEHIGEGSSRWQKVLRKKSKSTSRRFWMTME